MCLLFAAGTAGSVFADDVAKIGETGYATLTEAVEAATEGQTVTLLSDVEVTDMLPITKSMTLDMGGNTIKNNVQNNRLFRLSNVAFSIENGTVTTPTENTDSYGFVDFRDASGAAGASTSLKAKDMSFIGGTNEGSLFAFRASGQSLEFENVNVNLTESFTYSIINGYQLQVNITLKGGDFVCRSTHTTAGVFQAGAGSTISFEGVNVDTTVGPIFEVIRSKATFTDCTMKNTATNSYFGTCIAASNGSSDITVTGGSYEANYALYIYNSGGTINAEGGEYTGRIAALKADNSTVEGVTSAINVTDGVFNGGVSIGNASELNISGGTFDTDITDYCTENFTPIATTDADGNTVYTVTSETEYNVALTSDNGKVDIKNVASGETLDIDGGAISALNVIKPVDNVTVSYKRTFTGMWESLFVPFGITITDDLLADFDFAEIWDTERIDGNTTIEYVQLTTGDVIEPNTPCLVKAKEAGEKTISVSGATLRPTEIPDVDCSTIKELFTFKGVYENTKLLENSAYFLYAEAGADESSFCSFTDATAYIRPCHFYMTISDKATGNTVYPQQGSDESAAKRIGIRIIGNGGTTAIRDLKASYSSGHPVIYSLQGLRMSGVDGLKRGVYIVNGKKVVIK